MKLANGASTPNIPPQVAQRAVEWLVELQSGNVTEKTRSALQHWLMQHDDHLRAWRHIESVNASMKELSSPFPTAVARAALSAPRSAKRREAIKTLSVLFFVGSTVYVGKEQLPWQAWSADERTAVGERRTLTLSDGTQIALNTDSAINVTFTDKERRVHLLRGEIMVTTGKDGHVIPRPFLVQTAEGELQPIGTRFVVRQQDQESRLDVYEGAVEIRPRDGTGTQRVIHAGERTQFTRDAIADSVILSDDDGAWTEGMLIVSGMRLQDFLMEVSRHRRGRMTCDPAIADLRVSGTYPLNDTDLILSALRKTLPVDIHFLTRYWVTVKPTRAV